MKPVFILTFLISILFSSCIDIVEALVLNKNGSGKYSLTMDMSKLMADPMMKGLLEAGDGEKMKDMDSVIYFRDMPDSIIKDNPDLWKRVSIKIFSNAASKKLYTTVLLDFKSIDEIAYVSENLEKVMGKMKAGAIPGDMLSEAGSPGFLSKGLQYTFAGKELMRKSEKVDLKDQKMEDMEMMKTFLTDATYKITYEMPGKVKQSTMAKAKIEGKMVMVEVRMVDLIENKANLDGLIRFK